MSQQNLVMNSGVYSSRRPNYHHQIIPALFKLNIFYPPPNNWVTWHYQDAINDLIWQSVWKFNRTRAVSVNGVNKEMSSFNEAALNIMEKVIHRKTKIFNNRETAWLNNKIENSDSRKKLKESFVNSVLPRLMVMTWSVLACWKCPAML